MTLPTPERSVSRVRDWNVAGNFDAIDPIAVMHLETARPGGQTFDKALVVAIVSFGMYLAIAAPFLLDADEVPQCKVED